MKPYPVHPVAQIFPLIEGQAFLDMAHDVELRGVRDPVWLWKGQLIDGRNRVRCWEWALERRQERAELAAEAARAAARHLKLSAADLATFKRAAETIADHDPESTATELMERLPAADRERLRKLPRLEFYESELQLRFDRLLPRIRELDPEAVRLLAKMAREQVDVVAQAEKDLPKAQQQAQDLAAQAARPLKLPTRTWDGKGSLVAFIMSLNLHRRHLSESQRAMIAGRAAGGLEEEARTRKLARLKKGDQAPKASAEANGKTEGKTAETAAKLGHVSRASVERARKILKHGTPELAAAVDAGKISVSKAAEFVKLSPEEQKKRIKEEGAAAQKKVRELDLADAFGRWQKNVAKLLRQFAGCETPLPAVVRAGKKLAQVLASEARRLIKDGA